LEARQKDVDEKAKKIVSIHTLHELEARLALQN
jgi:hypothetical protein